jgi:WD40 repeat protein
MPLKSALRCDAVEGAWDFSPDGRLLALGSSDGVSTGRLEVWDLKHKKVILEDDFETPTSSRIIKREFLQPFLEYAFDKAPVVAVRFSPDGRWLAHSAEAGSFHLLHVESARDIAVGSHSYAIGSITFSPDGRYVVTGSRDTTACVWDVSSIINP